MPPTPDPDAWLKEVLARAGDGERLAPTDSLAPQPPVHSRKGPDKNPLVSELRREISSIDFRAPPPDNPLELGEVITKARSIVRRLVAIATLGSDREAIEASKLIFSYVEGLPVQPIEFDVARVVMALAEDRGLAKEDVDRAVSETKRIINQARTGA